MKYTVVFQFPNGPAYKLVGGGFTGEFGKNVRTWESKEIAASFATDMCGKYGYVIIEVLNACA